MADRITRLTAEIVTAYVAGQAVSADVVPELIWRVHQSLWSLPVASRLPLSRQVPARARPFLAGNPEGVYPDHLVRLACGTPMKTLKRHLAVAHRLTPERYQERFNLEADYPITAPDYARTRLQLAKQSRLGHRR